MRSVEQITNTSEHCTDITIQEVEAYLARIKPDKPDELIPLF